MQYQSVKRPNKRRVELADHQRIWKSGRSQIFKYSGRCRY